jgi:hypothetical protein
MSESLKKCIKCEKEIPQKAAKCEFCNSSQVKPKDYLIGCGVLVLIFLLFGSCMAMFDGSDSITAPPMVDVYASNEIQVKQAEKIKIPAFAIAQQAVKKVLKAPSTAEFASYNNTTSVIWWKKNTFLVTHVVDAQNSFGAMIRTKFMVELEYKGKGEWNIVDVGSLEKIMEKKTKQLESLKDQKKK